MPFKIVEETPEEEVPTTKFRIIEETSQENIEEKPSIFKNLLEKTAPFRFEPSKEALEKVRHPLGVSAKGFAKGVFGTPGDLANFVQQLVGIKKPLTLLPTSEMVGDLFDKLTEEQFNPENLPEEFAERGAEFLGSIIGLGGPLKAPTFAKTIGRNILAAFAPAGVSLFAEKANLPPWAQVASTIGTSYLTHRLTGKGLNDIERGLYKKSRELAGDNVISAKNLKNSAQKLITELEKGGIEASDKPALKKITDALGEIKDDKIKLQDLLDTKVKLNEVRGQLFEKDLGKAGVRAARKKINDVAKLFDNTIKEFENPEFQQIYKQANQLHGGRAETTKTYNFLKKNILPSGIGAVILKTLVPSAAKGALAAVPVAQVGYFMKALAKYPGYRKAYFEILKNAAKEDARGTISAVKKLEKKTEKLDPEMRYRIIED